LIELGFDTSNREIFMSVTIATDSLFNSEERDGLRLLVGMIIPASQTYTLPGADDERIFADILDSARANEVQIRNSLAYGVENGLGAKVSAAELCSRLEGQPVMAPLVSLVMQCYYRDDRVMLALEMEPRPPFPNGYDVPQGDWSMLDAVQKRGKIWRDV